MYRISGDYLIESNDAIHGQWRKVGRIIARASVYIGHVLNIYWVNMNDCPKTSVFEQRTSESATLGRVTLIKKIARINLGDRTKIRENKCRELQKIRLKTKVGNGEGVGSYSLRCAGMSLEKNIQEFSDEKYCPDAEIKKLEKTNRKDRRQLMSRDERFAEYVKSMAERKKIEYKNERRKVIEDVDTVNIKTFSTPVKSTVKYTGLVPFIQQFPQKILSLKTSGEKCIYKDGQLISR